MTKSYQTQVNGEYEFDFTDEKIQHQDIISISEYDFHILYQHQSHQIQVLHKNFLEKTYHIKINSNIYEVKISDSLDLLIKKLGLSLGKTQIENKIKAPMPGLILEINVKENQVIKEGESLLVLEAMKMENTITATSNATIKSIKVKKGQSVSKNELLIELE
ncbi:acetyl-CoA carboxylase biotin carboxyl carrier protein subunit [Flavobacterium sp. CS20]|jgi:biotin carboxyl carrier protein|uniref:acetyl-CoA carboxylase biotin carboxyl carrier protein subunit n=1 Tax=Flavobacterium sp. CS20 TaxID=2775246 RepID=UPI001B3A5583|nr:acetyl-CoA carboxylase biotin carboxyl carrier protein subunit [Flavobacterium sp. CS20]QTY26895.1 acetyl-CoA carboxylase biotin carboxyl carrier protein subunit [Flavobacterium sp. CS20]